MYTAAHFSAEVNAAAYYLVPIAFRKTGQIIFSDIVLYKPIHHTGIEIIARTYGTHSFNRLYSVCLPEITRIKMYILVGISTDKVPAIETDVILINLIRIVYFEQVLEVLSRAAQNIRILKVLTAYSKFSSTVGISFIASDTWLLLKLTS